MSTPMHDIPEHFPMPINAAGQGPEMDESLVVRTVCWSCLPAEDWPCGAVRLEQATLQIHMTGGLTVPQARELAKMAIEAGKQLREGGNQP